MTMQTFAAKMQRKEEIPFRTAFAMLLSLSIPAILEQLVSTVMGYIDSAMVGHLGAQASAAIGVVTSTIWVFSGITVSLSIGFSVQIAQYLGAGRKSDAQEVLRQAMVMNLLAGIGLGIIAVAISGPLPRWLGADESICEDASRYFRIWGASVPFHFAISLYAAILRCSGDSRTPSVLNILAGPLDVIFNFFFIYPTGEHTLLGITFTLPGAGMGVAGASIGTTLATAVVSVLMLIFLLVRKGPLQYHRGVSWRFSRQCMRNLVRVGLPCAGERMAQNGAQVVMMAICAKLGVTAIAANSLAVTGEAICYLPAFGIQAAAMALVGQSMGAGRRDMMKRFAYMSNNLTMILMAFMGAGLYLCAEPIMRIFTPDTAVIALGAEVLRMEAFCEPLYGASIAITGALRGAGDSTGPFLINLISMWGVRIPLAAILAGSMGLRGVWLAMALELSVRGILSIIRMVRGKWLKVLALE